MADNGIAGIRWAKDAAGIAELGAFFATNAVKLPDYVSHGEIQFELSRDGVTRDKKADQETSMIFAKRLSRRKGT